MFDKTTQKGIVSKGYKPTNEPTKQTVPITVTNSHSEEQPLKWDASRKRYYFGNPLPTSPSLHSIEPDEETESSVIYKLGQ